MLVPFITFRSKGSSTYRDLYMPARRQLNAAYSNWSKELISTRLNANHDTALHFDCRNGLIQAMEELVRQGADLGTIEYLGPCQSRGN